jgi:hypothetical protein
LRKRPGEHARVRARQTRNLRRVDGAAQDGCELLGEKVLLVDFQFAARPSVTNRCHQLRAGDGCKRPEAGSQEHCAQAVAQPDRVMGPEQVEDQLDLRVPRLGDRGFRSCKEHQEFLVRKPYHLTWAVAGDHKPA